MNSKRTIVGLFFLLLIPWQALSVHGQSTQEMIQNMERSLNSGQLKFKQYDYRGAITEWENGLQTAEMVRGRAGGAGGIATFANNIGMAYDALGDYSKALDYYQKAWEIMLILGDKPGTGRSFIYMGQANYNMGVYSRALDYFQQALKILRKAGAQQDEGTALRDIGLVYYETGDYAKALDYFQQALKISRNGTVLRYIGMVYSTLGDYIKALDYTRQGLAAAMVIGDVSGQIDALSSIAMFFSDLGDYPKALDEFQKLLKISVDIGNKQKEGNSLINIGFIYYNLGDYANALDHYRRALKVRKETGESTGSLELNIGDAQLGLRYWPAAAEIFHRVGDPLRLGQYYLARGEIQSAKGYFTKVAGYAQKTKSATQLISGFQGLGESLELLGEREPARGAYDQAITAIERQRELLPRFARANYFSAKDFMFPRISGYEGRCRVAESPTDGFFWSENTKARLFIEAMAAGAGKTASLPKDLARAETEITNRIAGLYKELDLAFQKQNKEHEKELEPELARAKKEQSEFIAKLRKDYPEYAAIQYPQPLKPEAVELRPGEVLLEYEVTEPKTLLFVLAKGKPVQSFEIAITRDKLKELVQAYRKPFEDEELVMKGGFEPKAGAELYELLLKPALAAKDNTGQPLIAKGTKLIIVPDEVLGLLPFEALPEASQDIAKTEPRQLPGRSGTWPTPVGLHYAGDDYDISYAQSATALSLARTLRKDQAAGSGFFVLADPIFDRSDPRFNIAELSTEPVSGYMAQVKESVSRFMGVKDGGETALFGRLAQTGVLAGDLQRLFPGEASVLAGKDASERRLLAEDLSRYRYLVFATHGILDTDVPYIREPALVLNQFGNGEDENGYLTMSKVMGLKLKADMVALTACKTGMGRQVSGEGVMGLGRAFQYAGARNVLVSLWSVAEESTTRFTTEFFTALKAGKTPREAIKEARTKIRAAGYEHPFFWAPFILMGE